MNQTNKGKAKVFSEWLCAAMLLILTFYNTSLGSTPDPFTITQGRIYLAAGNFSPVTILQDTIPVRVVSPNDGDTIPVRAADSSLVKAGDSTTVLTADTFNFKIAAGALDVPVEYHADDSMVIGVPQKSIIFYGKKSTVKYSDNDLEAPVIEYSQSTNLVKAHLTKDSVGKVIAYPKFKQADFETQSDTIIFNMKTEKGITKGTYTKQGEMFVYGETIKKVDEDVFYALRGRFTTCNLDTPHFAFVSSKIKFIQDKMAFTGPVHPEFEGVPVPVILPFGIYPLSQGRHSGLIAPSFASNDQMGISLEGLGYYKILSPNWDVIFQGTIYSYGGWTGRVNPRYYKRYRYQGNLGFDMQQFKTNFKGDPDFRSTKTVNVTWTHSTDSKARPGVSFSANVNAGSSKHNELIPNNPNRNFQNRMQSSITYSKQWRDYNLSVSANHNQNTLERLINFNLPDISFNANTMYPFRRGEPIGQYKWYENIGVALNTQARSLSSFYDTAGNIGRQIVDRLQWGANHNVPITLSLPSLGPFQISPSVSYQEKWYDQRMTQKWNGTKIDSTIEKGLYRAYDMSFGVSASTRVFGMFTFNKGKVQAIRHEIRPYISVNYKPDLNSDDWDDVQVDTNGFVRRYSVYERSIFGAYGEGRFGGLSFGVDNNLSMKVKSKKDTSAEGVKKISLIDGFSITSSYNFLRDSFRLEPFSLSARSNLFEKINITASAVLDPYKFDPVELRRVDEMVWNERFSVGSLTSAYISMQTSFRGGDKKKDNTPDQTLENVNRQNMMMNGMPLDEYQQELTYMNNNPGEFVDFSIPWDVSFSYSLRVTRTRVLGTGVLDSDMNQDVNWNGSLNLTPKWKIGLNGSYNITQKDLGMLSMYLSREMHCWQMAINISPVGRFKFFNISISPKSAILRDLKINRTRSFIDL